MAIGFLTETTGVNPEMYDQVQAKVDAESNPPEGLIFHTAGFTDSSMVVFDVWESREAFERFETERLAPAIQEMSGGATPPQQRREIYELHDLIRP
jgi:hypothetical protein